MNNIERAYAARIARTIRVVRKRKGLTQMELANILDISQSAVSKLESEVLVPSAPLWFSFCEATGTRVECFWKSKKRGSRAVK